MTRSNGRSGTGLENTGIASSARETAERKQPANVARRGAAIRYLYMAGALAAAVLLIMLAAV
jgi:hypothetical protein